MKISHPRNKKAAELSSFFGCDISFGAGADGALDLPFDH
jgi:hypothetical protein